MKLTQLQRDGIRLILRSADIGDGWRQCAPVPFQFIVDAISTDLVERNEELRQVRLTPEGQAVAKWAC